MQTRYPNDRFEVILRKVNATSTPEWRIKCLDCPGKVSLGRSTLFDTDDLTFREFPSFIPRVQEKPCRIMTYI